jgi:hypothetical protein
MRTRQCRFPTPKRSRSQLNDVTIAQLIVRTRQCRVLTVGNINSDATGCDITQNSRTQNYYRAQSVPRHSVKNKTLEISAPNSHLTAFLNSAKR